MASEFNNFNQTLYNMTNGKYSLGSMNGVENTFVDTVGHGVVQVATKDFKTEGNTVYENQQRVARTAAVMSLVIGDANKIQEENNFKDMMSSFNNNNSGMSWLQQIGYTGTAGTDMANLSKNTFNYTDASGVVHKETTGIPLNREQIQALSLNGTCTINGRICSIEGMSKSDTIKHANSILRNYDHEQRLQHVTKRDDMIFEMGNARNTSINYIKTQSGPQSILAKNIGSGTSREISNCRTLLANERTNILNQLGNNPQNANALRQQLAENTKQSQLLDNHINNMGNSDHSSRRGLTGRQRYGLSIVGQNLAGSDMMTGYRTTARTLDVAMMSVRTVYGLSLNTAQGATHLAAEFANRINPSSRITQGFKRANDRTKLANDRRKEYRSMRRSGDHAGVRNLKAQRRNEDSAFRNAQRNTNLKNSADRNRKNGNTRKADRLERRRQGLESRANRRAARLDRHNSLKEGVGKFKKSLANLWENSPFGKLQKLYRKITDPFRNLIDTVKKAIVKFAKTYLLPPLLIFLLVIIIEIVLGTLISILGAFFASDDAEPKRNYTQKIVDEISQDMGKKYVEIAKKDATYHYTFLDTAPVSGYAKDGTFTGITINGGDGIKWHKAPNKGTIGNIVSWDGTRKLESVNSNLLPITSLMHARFCNIIDKDNYLTAKAYMYYMYAHSHEVDSYDYKDIDDCAPENLYSEPITESNWDIDNKKLRRPSTLCNNVYLHGYKTDTLNAKFNQASAKIFEIGYKIGKVFTSESFEQLLDENAGKVIGIWVQEKPYDEIDGEIVECKNYVATVYSTTEYETGPNWDDWYSELICKQRPHIHDASCYSRTCEEEDEPCTLPGDHSTHHPCNGSTHEHLPGPPGNYESLSDADYNECWTLTCDKHAHIHTAWFEPYDDEEGHHESCYKTVYICKGHCGGHILPVVNIKVADDWENLMKKDNGRIAMLVTDSTFNNNFLGRAFANTSLSAFQTFWDTETTSWFIISRSAISTSDGEEDINDFEGWQAEDGTYTEQVEFMTSLDGSVDDKFKDGVENWKSMEVTFPLGGGTPLNEDEIDTFMEELLASNPSLSESRQAAIRKAMEYVGMFWYDLQAPGTMEDESGRMDCSGFISSVLYHADIGFANDWTASGYSAHGSTRSDSIIPGDILSKNTNYYAGKWSGDGQSNHVIMYVGHLSDGPDGDGDYIIDCSSSQGGSCLRKMSNFNGYNYCYRECY